MLFAILRKRALFWPALAVATVLFYSIPLFSRQATIHWDLADVSYPAQHFFADSLRAGASTQWTPYLYSGIPFLAEPRSGALFPLHWPFFLLGITPRVLVWELALFAFLALAGAYLLALHLFGMRDPALLGAVLYAWSGFFAAHASLLWAFETAALLPWVLWALLKALESGGRWIAITGLFGGLIALAGDQSATVETLLTLGCVALARAPGVKRLAGVLTGAVILAIALGGIVILPAIELRSQFHPPLGSATFHVAALATLVTPDYYGTISGLYSGPEDPRQYYLYGGLLLVPLAVAGFLRRERWIPLLAMVAPAVIFDMAKRPPGDTWFPAALGLAMAAASGTIFVIQRTERPYVWVALVALSAMDLWFWNLYKNPLVFARTSFSDLYGASPQTPAEGNRPFARIWAPYPPVDLGPADGSLISHTEVTYGTGLAELDRYKAYMKAVEGNRRLLNGLGVTDLIFGRGRRLDNPDSLGRVSAPQRVEFVSDSTAALAMLGTLDPAKVAVVEAAPRSLTPGVGSIEIENYASNSYKIRYVASSDSLLRIAVPYYPGWTATVDTNHADLVPADEALIGVFVPAGRHELTLQFRPLWFRTGAIISILGVVALVLGLILIKDSPPASR